MSSSSAAELGFGVPEHITKGIDDPASQLLDLRQIESEWYQRLFQSSHEVIMEPWQTRSTSLNGMHSWARALPTSTPHPLKLLFLSEMFFGSILLLSPPGRPSLLSSYGKALVFDNAIRYSEVTLSMCDPSHSYNYCTSDDTLRAHLVGHALLGILEESPAAIHNLLSPSLPPLPPGSGAPPAPRRRTFAETVDDAINGITRIDQILNTLGRRFGSESTYERFKLDSAATLQRLYVKQPHQYPPAISQSSGMSAGDAQSGRGTIYRGASWDHYSGANAYRPL